MKKLTQVRRFIAVSFLTACLAVAAFAQTEKVKFATEDDLKEDLSANVCKGHEERREAVEKLFKKMGAADDEITVEKIKDVENVVVRVKGKTDETIVVGAHYDKTSDGCGAIDNWTGVVIVANLYRTLKQFATEKTYIFVAFGKEELGLVGSEQMARAIPKEKRAAYCAMVNLDSFGLSYPQVMTNISDPKLIDLAKEVSDELKLPFAQAAIENANSDSASFRKQKIPAVTIHGLSDKWQDYLHNSRDQVKNINVKTVFSGYRFALGFLVKADAAACAAFRK